MMKRRPEWQDDDEKEQEGARERARERAREDQERRMNDLAIGRGRFELITKGVILVVVVTTIVLRFPHIGESWVPLLALGLLDD
jgi:hypothetical protein